MLAEHPTPLEALRVLEHDATATPARGLGLTLPDLEELLTAIGDREDTATADSRARLARGRHALELELARILAE